MIQVEFLFNQDTIFHEGVTAFLSLVIRVVQLDSVGLCSVGRKFEVDDRRVKRCDGHAGVLSIELYWHEGREALERLVDLKEFCLHALKLICILTDLFFHNLGRICSS